MIYSIAALGSCVFLGIIIYWKEVLDGKGSFAAAGIGVLVYSFSGSISWLLLLFLFLFISFLATKYGFKTKHHLLVLEGNGGKRGALNVLANGVVFTAFAVLFYLQDLDIFKAGYLASLATVTGDTLSSEIGVLSRKEPLLITSFRRVMPGTDGGVTLAGEMAGIFGALLIAFSAWLLDVASLNLTLAACLAGGFVGFNSDSLLGATLERRKLMGNASVNFLSSLWGSIVGAGAVYILFLL